MSAAGQERGKRIQDALREYQLDLLICALPANALMMSGYWPVVGAGITLAFRGGPIVLLIPADESDLATSGWPDAVHTFQPASLQSVGTVAEAIEQPLAGLAGGPGWRIGYEAGESSEPASYAAMHLYGGRMASLIGACFPSRFRSPRTKYWRICVRERPVLRSSVYAPPAKLRAKRSPKPKDPYRQASGKLTLPIVRATA